MSPFEDLDPDAEEAGAVKYLLDRGHTVGYKNNTFGGARTVTPEELYIMLASPETFREKRHMGQKDIYQAAKRAVNLDIGGASGREIIKAAESVGAELGERAMAIRDKKTVTRLEAVPAIADMVRALEK